jgi:ribosomal protein L7Ae-like RNA K-turn-binding protein
MFPPTKRQRLENPPSWMDCETLSSVAAPFETPIRTPLVSQLTKEIFIERFQKEILVRFHYSLSNQMLVEPPSSLEDVMSQRTVLKKRILVGTNACTRALEAAVYGKGSSPLLLVLAADLNPPTILAHTPVLAKQTRVPILLLPGLASAELGKALGTKKVAIMCFQPHVPIYRGDLVERDVHGAVDSFVDFMLQKLQGKPKHQDSN